MPTPYATSNCDRAPREKYMIKKISLDEIFSYGSECLGKFTILYLRGTVYQQVSIYIVYLDK